MGQFEHLACKTEFSDFINMILGNIIAGPLSSVDSVFGTPKESHGRSKISRVLHFKHTLNSFKQELTDLSTEDQLLHYTVRFIFILDTHI